jgi:hypothetical protein
MRAIRSAPPYIPRIAAVISRELGVLLRSILVEKEPIDRQHETVSEFAPAFFGIESEEAEAVSDDAIGRALDRLFDADRAALLTDVVVAAVREFDVALDELHNDSTSVSFCGQYRTLTGAEVFQAHKRQPTIEKRFQQTKTVLEIAPVLLKNEDRIEDVIDRIFDPFFTTKRRGGTGLGLAISKQIVEELHGRIAVESEPERWTRFTIDLPFAQPAPADPASA